MPPLRHLLHPDALHDGTAACRRPEFVTQADSPNPLESVADAARRTGLLFTRRRATLWHNQRCEGLALDTRTGFASTSTEETDIIILDATAMNVAPRTTSGAVCADGPHKCSRRSIVCAARCAVEGKGNCSMSTLSSCASSSRTLRDFIFPWRTSRRTFSATTEAVGRSNRTGWPDQPRFAAWQCFAASSTKSRSSDHASISGEASSTELPNGASGKTR